MKKALAAIVLAGSLALSGMTVMAGELNWSDVSEMLDESGIAGDFVTFDEVAVTMWMPDVLQPVELTDEDREQGYIGYYTTEDESASVGISYVDVDGLSLDDYETQLPDLGATEVTRMLLNGLDAVTYDLPDQDTSVISFATEAGYILEVAFAPYSDEDFQGVMALIGASIQPEAMEEESETE